MKTVWNFIVYVFTAIVEARMNQARRELALRGWH